MVIKTSHRGDEPAPIDMMRLWLYRKKSGGSQIMASPRAFNDRLLSENICE
jgi:hypothetical protein